MKRSEAGGLQGGGRRTPSHLLAQTLPSPTRGPLPLTVSREGVSAPAHTPPGQICPRGLFTPSAYRSRIAGWPGVVTLSARLSLGLFEAATRMLISAS